MDATRNASSAGVIRRPSSIAELAERAMLNLYDDSKDFKYYLRVAEKYRKEGKECARKGDLEGAFVELVRAAALVLEKLPLHRDYQTMLNPSQRQNLALNGQDILDNLSNIKPTLVDQYDKWLQKHPDDIDHERTPNARTQSIAQEAAAEENVRIAKDQRRRAAEEALKWKQQNDQQRAQNEDGLQKRAGAAAVAAAACNAPDYTFCWPPPVTTTSPILDAGTIRYPSLMSQHQKTQGYFPSLGSTFVEDGSSDDKDAKEINIPEDYQKDSDGDENDMDADGQGV